MNDHVMACLSKSTSQVASHGVDPTEFGGSDDDADPHPWNLRQVPDPKGASAALISSRVD